MRTPIEREARLSVLGRGPGGRPVTTHFLHLAIAADPALGMNVRFLGLPGEPEWRCTPRGALYLDHERRCFLAGTCPEMVKAVTGFDWGLADLVEIVNGGAPRAAPGEELASKVTEVGCNVESTKPPLHSWRVKHQFKLEAAPSEPCPAPYEISYTVVELPYSDELRLERPQGVPDGSRARGPLATERLRPLPSEPKVAMIALALLLAVLVSGCCRHDVVAPVGIPLETAVMATVSWFVSSRGWKTRRPRGDSSAADATFKEARHRVAFLFLRARQLLNAHAYPTQTHHSKK